MSTSRIFATLSLAFLVGIQIADAQQSPPLYNSSATYHYGDMVYFDGNYYRAILPGSAGFSGSGSWTSKWELAYATRPMTLIVTQSSNSEFPTLESVWNYIKDAQIAQGVTLTIQINGPFSEHFTKPLVLNHAYGSQIRISGLDANNINLIFDEPQTGGGSGFNGIVVDRGHTLSLLSNVTISAANARTDDAAINIEGSSTVNLERVSITNFGFACFVGTASHVSAIKAPSVPQGGTNYSVQANGFNQGVVVTQQSSFVCPYLSLDGSTSGATNGIVVRAGSYAEIPNSAITMASISTNTINCVDADSNSTVLMQNSTVSGGYNSIVSEFRSFINADGSATSGYHFAGFFAQTGGGIYRGAGSGSYGNDGRPNSYVN